MKSFTIQKVLFEFGYYYSFYDSRVIPLNLLMAHFWFSCFHVLTLVSFGLATGRWFSLGTPVSSTNKTDRHDITEILLKVALNTIKPNPQMFLDFYTMFFTTIHNPSWTFQLWFQSYAPMDTFFHFIFISKLSIGIIDNWLQIK